MEDEKHGRGQGSVPEALRMVEAFASVGVVLFDLTHTNLDQEKRGFRPRQPLKEIRSSIPHLVPASFRRLNNVILRPHRPPPVLLIQLDDLDAPKLAKLQDTPFLALETSPGNFQAWIAVHNPQGITDPEFTRRLRKGAGADPTASGATRCAGTANHKRKYAPAFPVIRIDTARMGHIVSRELLESLDLLAAPDPRAANVNAPHAETPSLRNRRARGVWPSYAHCLSGAPKAHGGEGIDISRADFAWCVTAIDWGWSVEQVAERLLQESTKARENGLAYAQLTASNAATAVANRYARGYRGPA